MAFEKLEHVFNDIDEILFWLNSDHCEELSKYLRKFAKEEGEIGLDKMADLLHVISVRLKTVDNKTEKLNKLLCLHGSELTGKDYR